ncbi:MAG: hypothetical protein Q7W02_02425 [Candidatus Rokubacteria bacterium]|nr:hypothetical protein [Candidatus Rokubacteria bacterium]
MSTPIRPDVHRRFQAVVRRGIARADRERVAELAALRPVRRQTDEARRWGVSIGPPGARPST